mgnify:CR=1 FL=1
MREYKIIAVDFDGTISFTKWPELGEANTDLINLLKKWKEKGNKLILWTCREGALLAQAVDWCRTQGLTFDAVNDNLEETFENLEQIEISRYYEKLPKPTLIAAEEFIHGRVYHRNPAKEKESLDD